MEDTRNVRRRIHYNSSQKILLVGEGDFSFSASLARTFSRASNMVATSLLTKEWLMWTHASCEDNLSQLRERGCLVLHGVDALTMKRHRILHHVSFDVIIFNFPHAGHVTGLQETSQHLIQKHKELMRGFFKNARKMVKEGGQVHVRHKDGQSYSEWKLVELASEQGLYLRHKVEFRKEDHPGYNNKRGGLINGNKAFPIGLAHTFVFQRFDHLFNSIRAGVRSLVLA